MNESAIDHLLREFESASAAHDQPFDGSGDWRERVNDASTRMIVVSREIASRGPDAVRRFAHLVESGDVHLRVRAANHMLDFMDPEPDLRESAMLLVRRTAEGDSADSAAEKLWLENWKAEQQDE